MKTNFEKRVLACLFLVLSACSDANGLRIYESPSRSYDSPVMQIAQTRIGQDEIISRDFEVRHAGEYAVRYFWQPDSPMSKSSSATYDFPIISGDVTILDPVENKIFSSKISPPAWGNGMDIVVFSHRDLESGKSYRVKVKALELPDQSGPHAGTMEIELYFKASH